jgi:nucleoid-associated protein YgaU
MVRGMFFFIGLIAVAVILAVVMLVYAFRHPSTVDGAVSSVNDAGNAVKEPSPGLQEIFVTDPSDINTTPVVTEPVPAPVKTPAQTHVTKTATGASKTAKSSSKPLSGDLQPVIDNTPSKSTVSTPVTLTPAPVAETTYTVQSGDSLYRIAQRKLGDGNKWTEIAEANGLKETSVLRIGQKLKMP